MKSSLKYRTAKSCVFLMSSTVFRAIILIHATVTSQFPLLHILSAPCVITNSLGHHVGGASPSYQRSAPPGQIRIQLQQILEVTTHCGSRLQQFRRMFEKQARNQLGTLGGTKRFLRVAQNFKLCPTHPIQSIFMSQLQPNV